MALEYNFELSMVMGDASLDMDMDQEHDANKVGEVTDNYLQVEEVYVCNYLTLDDDVLVDIVAISADYSKAAITNNYLLSFNDEMVLGY